MKHCQLISIVSEKKWVAYDVNSLCKVPVLSFNIIKVAFPPL